MAAKRAFRFGAQVGKATSAKEWVDKARSIHDLGYSSLLIPDHFNDQLGPLVALTAAAMAAPGLRIGALVFDNDYRHPVDLAKEAATLDLLSEGRMELGLGAGWMITDYEQAGIPYDPVGVRIDRFKEGLAVIKGMFADGPFSYQGKHYQITNLEGFPKPVQRPGPPIIIGAGGKRMLGIAGREADIVNVNFSLPNGAFDQVAAATGSAAATAEKIKWVREAAGDRVDKIEWSVPVFFAQVSDHPEQVAAVLSSQTGMPVETMLDSPHFLVGSVDGIVETLERRREEFGFSYIIIGRETHAALAPVVARLAGK